MPEGTESLPEAIGSMQRVLNLLGQADIDWGVNADGWEFFVTNKYDKPVVAGKFTAADNIDHIAKIDFHFDKATVAGKVTPTDDLDRIEQMKIPPGGTAKIKGVESPWLKGWPAACAFWFQEPKGGTFEAWCSVGIDISTSILELGTVTRSTSTGLLSPLEAAFPPQHHSDVQHVYLQRRDIVIPGSE